MGVAGRSHRHRARDRAYTTRAYMLAREPGWAQIARLGADRTGGRGLGGGSGGESVWGSGSGSTPALARIEKNQNFLEIRVEPIDPITWGTHTRFGLSR